MKRPQGIYFTGRVPLDVALFEWFVILLFFGALTLPLWIGFLPWR